ncbi:protein GIGAS CELL1-like isoform X2 [Carica papaya]|uniref:protein GIGAS CELL1-like isoform X2 n=1 Tax=Carica papaya TaxID=3649 RepID=UPI000B8C8AC0|nr:protein GIGAS CELL1-like isoform X2 [Carica papaya]
MFSLLYSLSSVESITMPESRDRLSRPDEIVQVFATRRSGALGIFVDEQETSINLFESPVGSMAARRSMILGGGSGRGGGLIRTSFGTPRTGNGRGRNLPGTPGGRENTPAGGARRGRGLNLLPAWYPRAPLHDITAIAIERRRASLSEVGGQHVGTPVTHQRRFLDSPIRFLDSPTVPSAIQLKQQRSILSPNPSGAIGRCSPSFGKVTKILLDVTNQNAEESEALTPQKKLLKSIDTVEKLVTEELQKLKRTPTAKKAEREKKLRTLMSMR